MSRFKLTFKLDKDTMTHEDIAAVLRHTADRIERDDLDSGVVRDINGNTIGRFAIKADS